MNYSAKHKLIEAEQLAVKLITEAKQRNFFTGGQSEKELNVKLYDLAFELFGIKKFWHKRIVRAGVNTLCPYKENPINLQIQADDILFIDFGPVFENWEADIGETFVIGNNPTKLKLQKDVESAWLEGKTYYTKNKNELTGADFYNYTKNLAKQYGWEYGNSHCGHLIGNFPHEELLGEELINYIHPDNHQLMCAKDKLGNDRFWIYEIHFIDSVKQIGGFYERCIF